MRGRRPEQSTRSTTSWTWRIDTIENVGSHSMWWIIPLTLDLWIAQGILILLRLELLPWAGATISTSCSRSPTGWAGGGDVASRDGYAQARCDPCHSEREWRDRVSRPCHTELPSTVECSTSYRVGSVTFWGITQWPSTVAHRRLLWRVPVLTLTSIIVVWRMELLNHTSRLQKGGRKSGVKVWLSLVTTPESRWTRTERTEAKHTPTWTHRRLRVGPCERRYQTSCEHPFLFSPISPSWRSDLTWFHAMTWPAWTWRGHLPTPPFAR